MHKIFSRNKLDVFGFQIVFINKKKRGLSAIQSNTKEHLNRSVTLKTYKDFKKNINFYKAIVRLIPPTFYNGSVLDISCGVGILCQVIGETFSPANFWALDLSDSCIRITKSHRITNLQCKVHNIYSSLEQTFDVIFCIETLEHLLYPERALKNMLASLNDGGMVVITIPNGKIDTFEQHINFWSIDSWGEFIKKHVDPKKFYIRIGFFYQNQKNISTVIQKKNLSSSYPYSQ